MFLIRRLLPLLVLVLLAPAHAADTMQTRIFQFPPSFGERPPPGSPLDDFRDMLEGAGILFPEGAEAKLDPVFDLLIVTNAEANLELAQDFVKDITLTAPSSPPIAFQVTVIEGPGELIRQASAEAARVNDATEQLQALLTQAKDAGSQVRVVGDCFVEGKSGARSTTTALRERTAVTSLELDAKSRPSVKHRTLEEGMRLEIEPFQLTQDQPVECTLALTLTSAPTLTRQVRLPDPVTGNAAEFPTSTPSSTLFDTKFHTSSGHTKMIGVTRPGGASRENEDVLWAAFVTTTVRASPVPATEPVMVGDAGMGSLTLPVPDGLFEVAAEVAQGKPFSLQRWLTSMGVSFGPGTEAAHTGGQLHMTNTLLDRARVAVLVKNYLNVVKQSAVFALHSYEVPAALGRDLARQSLATADDGAMLAAVQQAAERGEAACVDFIFLNGEINVRSTWRTGHDHNYLSELRTDDKGRPALEFAERHVGSSLGIEGSYDGSIVTGTFQQEMHPAPAETRRDAFLDPASGRPFDMPVTDFHTVTTTSNFCMPPGGTRLLSLHPPVGGGVADRLWVTFVRCDVGPQIAPSVPHREAAPVSDPEVWETRSFRVPPDFMLVAGPAGEERQEAIELLKAAGIPFLDGATATYDRAKLMLEVRNMRANLALVAEFVSGLGIPPAKVVMTTQVLQGPGPLLRRLADDAVTQLGDHRALLDELLRVAAEKDGKVQVLTTRTLEAIPGHLADDAPPTTHEGLLGLSIDDQGDIRLKQERRRAGFTLHVEPTLSPQGMVHLTLESEFHTVAPQERAEHVIAPGGRRLEFPLADRHYHKTETHLSMPGNSVRLVSMWKPTGKAEFEKEDVLQVMFISCDVLRTNE